MCVHAHTRQFYYDWCLRVVVVVIRILLLLLLVVIRRNVHLYRILPQRKVMPRMQISLHSPNPVP